MPVCVSVTVTGGEGINSVVVIAAAAGALLVVVVAVCMVITCWLIRYSKHTSPASYCMKEATCTMYVHNVHVCMCIVLKHLHQYFYPTCIYMCMQTLSQKWKDGSGQFH